MSRFNITIIIITLLSVVSCTKAEEEIVLVPYLVTYDRALISWEGVFPDTKSSLFQVFLDGLLVTELEGASYYEIKGLKEATDYRGYVVIVNRDGSKSSKASFEFTTLKNRAPGSFQIDITGIRGTSATFSWTRPVDPDGDRISYAMVLNSDTIAKDITDLFFSVTGLTENSAYSFTVIARDEWGNQKSVKTFFETFPIGAELGYKREFFSGNPREYGFYIPSFPNPGKLPMVIHLHGAGGVVWPGMITDSYISVAEGEKFVCLMPQGRFTPDGIAYWRYDNTDLNFLTRLIDSAIVRYNIDTERIYMTGHSNGAFMTFLVTKDLEERIAAIGPIAGTLGYSEYAAYRLKKPMPLCYIHGTADITVAVTGNPTHVSFEKILEFWIPNNKVNPIPVVTELADINRYDYSTVTKFEYRSLNGRSGDIVYYRINNGNHSIPGTVSWSNKDISAWAEMWKFFKTRKLSDK